VASAAWLLVHLLFGAVGAGLARGYARSRALLDHPGDRRSHSVPTPRGGGIAIAVAMLLAAAWLAWRSPSQLPMLVGFATGLALVAAVGWLDDHRSLSAWTRLAVHVLAGVAFATGAWLQTGSPLVAAVALLGTVGLVNVWNFMDGIDGLAASQAILAVLVPAALAGGAGLALGMALAASALGFLPWNFPRARLFLGDVGSGAIGFAMGGLVAMAVAAEGTRALALSLLPLSAFLIDAGLTLATRMLRRERWWQPHVTHAFQRAARRHGHVAVTRGFAAWTGLVAAVAWGLRDASFTSLIISLVMAYAVGAIAWRSLRRGAAAQALENME